MATLDYGIIGNCKSAALVSSKGSLDWLCLPVFDSASVFGKLLDKEKGGSFEIIVDSTYMIRQKYLENTNILLTTFSSGFDVFELVDFMPRYKNTDASIYAPADIIRYFKCKSGSPKFKIKYSPKLEYAKYETENTLHEKYIKSAVHEGTYDSLYLYSSLDLGAIMRQETISLQEDAYCLISYNQKILPQNPYRQYVKMQKTKVYWLDFSDRTKSYLQYDTRIKRSALVLKLLSYDKTGAVLAAATTSLPETIGEVRNWDYRFCWLRDSSMVVKVMNELGHHNMSKRFMDFIIDQIPDKDEKIQIMYSIHGEKKLTEHHLEHLAGYENSAPVRIGNDAYHQKQLDIYGIMLDVVYQNFKVFDTSLDISENLWTVTRSVVRIVETHWQDPDKGIWEIRTEDRHFTFSKVLCWVAIDRAVKIAELVEMHQYAQKWSKLRKQIKEDIMEKAWSKEKQAFTQAYGIEDLDASNLLMETYGFIEARDPKYISTVRKTFEELSHNGLMYRYKNMDDFGLPSSSFTICTFWMIMALYKIGEKPQAKLMFDQLLSYSNHLGLYSEDIDFETKRLLGNFPQAYSHLALIETAVLLSEGMVTKEEKIMEALHGDTNM
jgi:alpha,alpha-trehalase